MNNERDTKFLGFARLLWPEIAVKLAQLDFEQATRQDAQKMDTEIYTLIAQRAYDLVEHVIKHIHGSDLYEMQIEGLTHFLEVSYPGYTRLPDLTEWPTTER